MTKYGKDYQEVRRQYKDECRAANAPCWLCRGALGPIDYDSPFDPKKTDSLQFTVDHVTPLSQGGDPVRRANFKPAHYQRVQHPPREHHTRPIPHVTSMVTLTRTG